MRNKKHSISNILLIVLFLVGLSVMLYPAVSDWWNSKTQGKVVADYQKKVTELGGDLEKGLIEQAQRYNRQLAQVFDPLKNYDKVEDYDSILDITGTGVMGIINIPQIGVELPVYHGTSEGVLNIAVGHLQGTSLPVGGLGTHAVISAHRGLPSAKLFSDLDKLIVGDEFTLTVLSTVYTYEVDNIFIVLPSDTSELAIDPDRELLTLMTCTPYGINTHRLLVRAHRTGTGAVDKGEAVSPKLKVIPDAVMVDSLSVVPFIAFIPAALLIGWWLFGGRKKKRLPKDPLTVFDDHKNNDKDKPDGAP